MHYSQLKFTCVLNRTLCFFIHQLITPENIQIYSKPSFIKKKPLFTSMLFTLVNKLSDKFSAE